TLYTYVPGKAELLDLMLDAAYQRMRRTDTAGQPWRQRVTAVAAENRALLEAHPWAAAISTIRPPLGPGLMAKDEHELSAFDGLARAATFGDAWGRAPRDHRGPPPRPRHGRRAVGGRQRAATAEGPRPGRLSAGRPRRNRGGDRPPRRL